LLEFNQDQAENAVKKIQLIIESMINDGHLQSNYAICIVKPDALQRTVEPGFEEFRAEMLLAVVRCGKPEEWLFHYDDIAISKAWLTYKHRKPSRDIPVEERAVGDTIFFGSVIVDNVVVAVSGFNPNLDEMFAYMIAHHIRGCALVRATPCFK
jgi:hypothetical protein